MATLTTTTATSMRFIGSRSCPSAMSQTDGGFSAVIVFLPYLVSLASASPTVRPFSVSLSSAAATSAAGSENHALASSGLPADMSVCMRSPSSRSA